SPGSFLLSYRLVAATSTGSAALFRRAEGMTAATGGNRVGVIHREPRPHQAVDIIDLGPLDKAEALRIDHHADALVIEGQIAFHRVVKGHAVLEAGAAAARH